MSLTQGSQLGPPSPRQWSNPPVNRANPAGVESPARPRWRRASENALRRQNNGGEVLRVAGELPHPVVQVVGHGDAANDAHELDSGGWSSANGGLGDAGR